MGQAAVSPQNLHRWLDDKVAANSEAIADLWLKGYSQVAIAKQLGLNRKRVRTCIDKARKVWLERKNIVMADMVAEQLRRVDLIEANAWEGYEKSQKDAVETSIETVRPKKKGRSKANDSAALEERKKISIRPQSGDPRFLKTALECIDMRCKLLGIYKPPEERTEQEVWGVLVEVDTPEEANAIMEYSEFQGKVVDAQSVQPAALEYSEREAESERDPLEEV